ncbi:hypothetical protein A3B26_00190 [Candidatus Giovannonibacteria bacterium RIFCSPLOWO2_01_FULL_48_47]|nr:MAG: hypothetical protein A3B26_00190 [Candidatus Giovannonibacteria bacterium RIFCSPLOWO2_01_FULL_48_47]
MPICCPDAAVLGCFLTLQTSNGDEGGLKYWYWYCLDRQTWKDLLVPGTGNGKMLYSAPLHLVKKAA